MNFVWDSNKSRRNLKRHGIAFEDAAGIFSGPTLEQVDGRFDYGDIRVYAIGIAKGLEVTVIYTDISADDRRIISAWRAERHEREAYWQSLGEK